MKEKTGTCFDNDPNVDMILSVGEGGNGACYVLRMEGHYRVLKILKDETGRNLDIESTALENYPIPFMPSLYDKSKNHPKEDKNWILIDYIPGPTLRQLISGGFIGYRIKKLIMLKILICIVHQLTKMNENNLKHRDLKSDNIIIDANLVPHIIDWGDATSQNSRSSSEKHGTIPFTAPEVFNNVRSTKSDIYSFGCVVFNLITEHFPYDGAYFTREGLNKYATNKDKLPSSLDEYYEALGGEEGSYAFDEICKIVEPIIQKAIQEGNTDQRFINDEDFLKDKLNARLSDLISKCWVKELETRISHDQLVAFIDETAKEVLSADELKEYEDYCDYIASVEPGTEYGTDENIEATFSNGLYQSNATLISILSDKGFDAVDDGQKFSSFLQSVSPN